MRLYIRNDQATKALSRVFPSIKRGVIIQVIGAGTCWFDSDRAPLENTDSGGTPTAGSSITAASGPFSITQWNDDLWLRGSFIGVAIEVTILGVR